MTTLTINRDDFWLLEVVVEFRVHFSVLRSQLIEEALNRRSHGLTDAGLVEHLLALLERKLIEGWREGDAIPMTRERLEAALRERGPRFEISTYFGLTATGGAAWEALARPNWALFHDGYEGGPDEIRVVEAATVELARAHFARGWTLPLRAEEPTVEVLSPWQATYWKQFPHGVRLKGRLDPTAAPVMAEPNGSRWYVAPFD